MCYKFQYAVSTYFFLAPLLPASNQNNRFLPFLRACSQTLSVLINKIEVSYLTGELKNRQNKSLSHNKRKHYA